MDIKISEALTSWEASGILERDIRSFRGSISSGAVKAFIVGARKRRDARARKLERLTEALERLMSGNCNLTAMDIAQAQKGF